MVVVRALGRELHPVDLVEEADQFLELRLAEKLHEAPVRCPFFGRLGA
jgi:hypothetical protein